MKGTPEVIASLNECLIEYHTSYIYFTVYSAMSKKWGYEEVNEFLNKLVHENKEAIKKLIDRIIFLDGVCLFDKLLDIEYAETIDMMMLSCKHSKEENISNLSNLIEVATSFKDFGTRRLAENLLVEEDELLANVEAKLIQFAERG